MRTQNQAAAMKIIFLHVDIMQNIGERARPQKLIWLERWPVSRRQEQAQRKG